MHLLGLVVKQLFRIAAGIVLAKGSKLLGSGLNMVGLRFGVQVVGFRV